ncbi:MAG TPA: alpha/beta fold hydrolase [Gemmatimonadaceae bacterium]|nr:alpha/beta fold hydrolase [Gemmatimonadaceae bacterium]
MRLLRLLVWTVTGVLAVYALGVVTYYFAGQERRTASDPSDCASGVSDQWVRGGRECLHIRVYRGAALVTDPDLIVVLHGDLGGPGYMYAAARVLAQASDSVIAVGMLRPGYTDDSGNRSSGVSGRWVGDNYTIQVVDAVAAAIDTLRHAFRPGHVILVGHSGGAAITANLIGRHPRLVDAAVLVSCPCDLSRFRRHMFDVQHQPIWWMPVHSLSPMDLAGEVDPSTVVAVIVGGSDNLAPPPYSRAYATRLEEHHVPVKLIEIPGASHNILLDPRVLNEINATRYLIPRVALDHARRPGPDS